MPVWRAGPQAPACGLPGAAAVVNPRLPCRATRDGRRGPRAPTKHSPLSPMHRHARESATRQRCELRWRGRVVAQSSCAGGSCAATRGLSGRREPGPARRRALRHHAPQSPRLAAIKRDACRRISELGEEPQKSAAMTALFLAAAVLLNRDLLRADLDDLRQRELQHAVDMLRLGGVRIDCFRQPDRTARLAKAALAP